MDAAKQLFEHYKQLKKKKSEYVLNSEYTAIVDRANRTVEVGCQTFPFSVIEGLVEEFK